MTPSLRRTLAASLLALPLLSGCDLDFGEKPPPENPCEPNPCTQENRGVCVSEDGNARCLCNEGFLARPSGVCEPVGAGNCPEHTGDSAEPDDCQARANDVTLGGEALARTIEPVGDFDFVRFEATARRVYVARAQAEGALVPRIDAFDQGGVHLGWDEHTGEAVLAFKARATAPHFLRVSHSPSDPSVATGSYSLVLEDLGLEDHGDAQADATPVVPDVAGTSSPTVNAGRFELPQDQDWFTFTGTTDQTYVLSFDPQQGQPLAYVVDAQGREAQLVTPTSSFQLGVGGKTYLVLYPPAAASTVTAYGFQLVRESR